VGSATSAVDSSNRLVANRLVANRLVANRLVANSLINSNLTSAGLDPLVLADLQDPSSQGDADRDLFHFVVGCALSPTQSVTYTWTDSQGNTHTVTEQGSVGLAPSWATQALRVKGQQLVSGCLAARVNYFGVEVQISLRNPFLVPATPESELEAYPNVEGAFWGNLFSSTPALYSCYVDANVDNSRADQRDCATGYLDPNTGQTLSCGPIQLTGSCSTQCAWFDPNNQFYVGCGDWWNIGAITVGLQ
jgi:hypothetical protein